MIKHLGIILRETKIGLKLSRENYVLINPHGSFGGNVTYDLEACRKQAINALINYDINMVYFKSLDKEEFKNSIDRFLKENPRFIKVDDLKQLIGKSGYYLMILDEYCQVYIGTSRDIYKRIYNHWHNRKEFDRLIFGGIQNSILSIDSFRPLDTTRFYVSLDTKTHDYENRYINSLPNKFICNRTIGGILDNGFEEAVENRKVRDYITSIPQTNINIVYEEGLNPHPCQLHEVYTYAAKRGFSMNTDIDGIENNEVDYDFESEYGHYSICSNIQKNTFTVKNISVYKYMPDRKNENDY